MPVRVLYFGSLREKLGRDEELWSAGVEARVSDIWFALNGDLPLSENTLCAINMEYARADSMVMEGDELAFFPPVTGG